jgi:hypothetical protein
MRRRLFAVASAISLLLCLASVALRVRSYFARDMLFLTHHGDPYILHHNRRHMTYGITTTTICVSRGFIQIENQSNTESDTPIPLLAVERGLSWPSDLRLTVPWWSCLGFQYGRDDSILAAYVNFPIWMLALMFAALPAWRETAHILRRSTATSDPLCPSCSYRLTGNTSGVCPECGTPVPKESAERSPRSA